MILPRFYLDYLYFYVYIYSMYFQHEIGEEGPSMSKLSELLLTSDISDLVKTCPLPKKNLDVLVRMCLADEHFPGFCASVEDALKMSE